MDEPNSRASISESSESNIENFFFSFVEINVLVAEAAGTLLLAPDPSFIPEFVEDAAAFGVFVLDAVPPNRSSSSSVEDQTGFCVVVSFFADA